MHFGELGHPEGPTVNLDRVSHMIEEAVPEGNNIIGKAKILDTPNGKIVKELQMQVQNLESLVEEWEHLKKGVRPTMSKTISFLQQQGISL